MRFRSTKFDIFYIFWKVCYFLNFWYDDKLCTEKWNFLKIINQFKKCLILKFQTTHFLGIQKPENSKICLLKSNRTVLIDTPHHKHKTVEKENFLFCVLVQLIFLCKVLRMFTCGVNLDSIIEIRSLRLLTKRLKLHVWNCV